MTPEVVLANTLVCSSGSSTVFKVILAFDLTPAVHVSKELSTLPHEAVSSAVSSCVQTHVCGEYSIKHVRYFSRLLAR